MQGVRGMVFVLSGLDKDFNEINFIEIKFNEQNQVI